jgi:hypothetical protein
VRVEEDDRLADAAVGLAVVGVAEDDVVVLAAAELVEADARPVPVQAIGGGSQTDRGAGRMAVGAVEELEDAVVLQDAGAEADALVLPRALGEEHRPQLGGRVHAQFDVAGAGDEAPVDEELLCGGNGDGG